MEGCIQILKFGGTSVGSGEGIRHVASIMKHHMQDGEGLVPVIVVSAMSDGTDQLLRIARFACTGDDESVQQELEKLKRKHMEAAEKAVQRSEVRQALHADLQVAFGMLFDGKERTRKSIKARHHASKQPERGKRVNGILLEKGTKLTCNTEMGPNEVRHFCQTDPSGEKLLKAATQQLHLSARAYHRVLKLARTIADLAGSEMILANHIAEAIQYRPRVGM
jgi:hypothetical protein